MPAFELSATGRRASSRVRFLRFAVAAMKDFADSAFSPDVIEIMAAALEASVSSLPEPVSAAHVKQLAESILRTAREGERDIAVLRRIALVELQITPRH